MLPVRVNDPVLQFFWDRKDRGIKIPYSKVVDLFSPSDLFADLAAKFDNF